MKTIIYSCKMLIWALIISTAHFVFYVFLIYPKTTLIEYVVIVLGAMKLADIAENLVGKND